jgi:hypothetical protein
LAKRILQMVERNTLIICYFIQKPRDSFRGFLFQMHSYLCKSELEIKNELHLFKSRKTKKQNDY